MWVTVLCASDDVQLATFSEPQKNSLAQNLEESGTQALAVRHT